MSNLPHPLGDTNPGDLFYPGSPDVIATDAPGAAGSRAVEFGEDGLSSAVNRAVYALAKNDEYQEARLEEEIARPDLVTFTPAGGNGGNYTFSVRVWCGDAFYTPEDQSMREALISVLDTRYNDLIDPATGDKIVVKEILDAPAGTTQVGTGFVTNPYITFRKMNPVTGALGADYTIPDGTKVWLAFGRSATLDALTTDTNVRDAWFRGFTRSIGEIHAASFLHDGSRPMSGHLNINGFTLLNANWIESVADTDLILYGTGAGHVNLLSDSGMIRFNDAYLPSYLPLNDGDTSLAGDHTSLLTSLNSKTKVAQAFYANRCLDRIGSFTTNGGTGQIDWPELHISIDGEAQTIAAGNIIATATSTSMLVVDGQTGTVVNRIANQLRTTDIPLFSYYWTGAAFTKALDVRWVYRKNAKAFEITVGDVGGGGNQSCDFLSGQLREAIELVSIMGAGAYGNWAAHRPVLRVVGHVYTDDTIGKYTLWAPIKIVGDGPGVSTIHSSEIIGDTVDLFDCQGYRVIVEDVTIMHSGDEQPSTLGAFKNPGSGSVFRNIKFAKDPGTYEYCFSRIFYWTSAASRVTIENIEVEEARHSFVLGSTTDFATAYLTNSRIRDCYLTWAGLAQFGCVVNGDGNSVENVVNTPGLDQYFVVGGNETLLSHCQSDLLLAANANHAHVFYRPLTSAAFGTGLRIRDCYFRRSSAFGIHTYNINDTLMIMRINIEGCGFAEIYKPLGLAAHTAVHASSSVVVDNCTFYDSFEQVAIVDNLWHFRFTNSLCHAVSGMCIWMGLNAGGIISNNIFEGYGADGAYPNAIRVEGLLWSFPLIEITNNFFGDTGAPVSSWQVVLLRQTTFTENVLINSSSNTVGLDLAWFGTSASHSTVIGNLFFYHDRGILVRGGVNGCRIEGNMFMDIDTAGIKIEDATDTLIVGNTFAGSAFQGIGILVTGSAAFMAECTQIIGNHFRGVQGIGDWSNFRFGVIYIEANASGACPDCLIDSNHLFDCGSDNSVQGSSGMFYIRTNGIRNTISNNHIRVLKGYATSGVTAAIYYASEPITFLSYGQIIGNNIRHNMNDGQGAQMMYGIYVLGAFDYIGSLVALNTVDFHGSSASGAGKTTKGLYVYAADDVTVLGNTIPVWTHTGASNLAIDDTFGTSNIYVANRCRGANVSLAANKPSQVAYSVNGNTPRADFNTASSGF